MIYFVIRYGEKRNPKADQSITGNTTLEVAWTIIPLILVIGMFFYGYEGFKEMRNPPPDAMVVKVTGKMWFWHFEYANGKLSDTLLYLPVGKNVKFELTSVDVIHSFFVSAFRTKEDCVPGKISFMWFNASKEGTYDIECAEYCGLNHAYMLGKVIIVPENEFNEWVSKIDSVKPVVDSAQIPPAGTMPPTDSVKTDTLKSADRKDTSKSRGKDSIKTKTNDSLHRKENK
jgi:cytochrome c oxidase subunit 2